MYDKAALLKALVLTIVSDDYESLTHVLDRVRAFSEQTNLSWTQQDVEEELRNLEREDLLSGFHLSPHKPAALKATLQNELLGQLWFYATARGRSLAAGIDDLQVVSLRLQ